MSAHRVPLVVVLLAALGAGALRAQTSAPAAWQATPASVLKTALRNALAAQERFYAANEAYAPSVEALGFRPEAGVRVDILVASANGWQGTRDAPVPAGPELRGLRRPARRRRGAAHRRRPRDGGRRRHPALRPDALAPHGFLEARCGRGRIRGDLDGPGLEVGGGLAIRGCRPRLHHLVGALAAGRPCALDRRRGPSPIRAWAIGDTIQLAITITDAHGGVVPGVRVGWTSTDTSVRARWTARAPWSPARQAPRRSLPRPVGGSRSRGSWSAPARRRSGSRETRCSGWAKAASPASSRAWSTPGGIRSPDSPWTMALVGPVGGPGGQRRPGHGYHRRPRDARRRRPAISWSSSPSKSIRSPRRSRCSPATDSARRRVSAWPSRSRRRSCRAAGGRWPASRCASRWRTPTGRIAPDADTSDADGIVQAVWTLGDRPGRQRSALAVDGEPPIATSLAADAEPVADNTRITPGEPPVGRGRPRVARAGRGPGHRFHGCAARRRSGLVGGRGRRGDRGGRRADRLARASPGALDARPTRGLAAGLRAGGHVAGRAPCRALGDGPGGAGGLAGPGSWRRASRHRRAPARTRRSSFGSPTAMAIPCAGVRVSLRPEQGTVAERTAVTDSTGRVKPAWTLGPAAGPQRLTASAAAR